jgi:DNA-binding SARP family transcriptional activator/tetratricopeptide (TPR) repeat protein
MGKAAAKVSELRPARAKKPGHLEIRLFGHLEIALDGARFDLATPRKSLQVLAYLLLHRAAPVSREYLAFLLYPDDEEGAARAKLRATLSDLSKILPQPADRYISIDADKVAWNPNADLWLDVDAFESASNEKSRLGEAIDLYRGDLLPAIYDEWLDVIRERFRNAYLRCLTERVSEARRSANLPVAIEAARRVLAVDPWREDVVRRVIAMRYESGDRAGALREYEGFAKRLRAEMNAEPMAETTAVAERISRDEAPADENGELDRTGVAGGSAVLPFVGRRDEMERLLETWSRVARGRGACTFVSGEAGIGKSRMAYEFAHAAEDRGGRVLVGTTSSPEAVPYEAVADALRSALPLVVSLKPSIALASVAALVPEINARVALPGVPRLDAESERIRLFESLFRCLADLASARPVLLVLEDLHWAQDASIELLQFVLRRISAVPVMILVTYRDEETSRLHALHRLRREARAASSAQSIWLSRLSAGDVEELRATLPDMRDRPAETLIAASQGNPLFLTQLVVEVREGERAAATSLQEVVARRVDRLSENARTAAEIAACIGDRFSRDAVREVSAWDETALTDALDELLDRRIIREAGGRGYLEYAFTHQLVHEAIAQAIPPKNAAIRRRRVARVLEELYPERVSELSALLAAHYECAGDIANATRCYLEAIRRSISIVALQEARALCDRALSLDAPLRTRADLLLESVSIESRSGDRESWRTALSSLDRIDSELGDPAIHRAALLRFIEFASTIGDRDAHERAVRELRASIPQDDSRWKATVHLAEARLAYSLGRLTEAYACGEAAFACSRAAGNEVETVPALCCMAEVETYRGHLSAAEALFDQAAAVASRAADPVLELLSLRSGWTIAYQRRDIARCITLAARCLGLAMKLGDRPAEAQAHGRLGVALAAEGKECARAREHFAASARIYGEHGNLAGTAGALMNGALLEYKLGSFERALADTEKAVELFERASDARGRGAGLANLVFLRAYTGQMAGARKAAEEGLELARQFGFELLEPSIIENMAFAEAAAGDHRRAIELAEASFELRSRSDSHVWSRKTLADVAIWQAKLGNLPAARDAVRRLLADGDAIMRGADWPSYCYWAAAQIFHLDGDSKAAAHALTQAKRLMQMTANTLEADDRERFLALPWHVDLVRAAADGAWPTPPR